MGGCYAAFYEFRAFQFHSVPPVNFQHYKQRTPFFQFLYPIFGILSILASFAADLFSWLEDDFPLSEKVAGLSAGCVELP